jgi:hypothetical protein
MERVSLGSLSEASRVFDAELLKPIIEELGQQLQPLGRDQRLADIPKTLTLVAGTLLSALPLLIQAMGAKAQTGQKRCQEPFLRFLGRPGTASWNGSRCRPA